MLKQKERLSRYHLRGREVNKMVKVAWISRHDMTEDQIADLRRIYGNNIVVEKHDITASSYRDVLEASKDADIIAVVLPPNILADLVNPRNNEKPVIRAISNREKTGKLVVNSATGQKEAEYRFVHGGWERIKKIEIIVEKL